MEIRKQPKTKPKQIKGFAIDENIYQRFREACKKLNLSMSSVVQEFIKRLVELVESGESGEVVFGVNLEEDEKR